MLRLMHVRMIAFSIGKTMPVPIHAHNVKPPDGNLMSLHNLEAPSSQNGSNSRQVINCFAHT
jgi:hypothetical protein